MRPHSAELEVDPSPQLVRTSSRCTRSASLLFRTCVQLDLERERFQLAAVGEAEGPSRCMGCVIQ